MVGRYCQKLYEKYQALLEENRHLKSRIEALESKTGSGGDGQSPSQNSVTLQPAAFHEDSEQYSSDTNPATDTSFFKAIDKFSPGTDKIDLFMSLFRGREDVFARRWENKKGKSGYSPYCLNEWTPGICEKPRIKCTKCAQRVLAKLDARAIESHLRGDWVVGIYPLRVDDTCCFLAMDFDGAGWQKDVSVVREVCNHFGIPMAVERSRSGNGAHGWFFFESSVPAALARKFGSSLLTYAMSRRHEIRFSSYDRLFPSQDTLPKGGCGNLIALPLQKSARKAGNSLFVDDDFNPLSDQWKYLSDIKKVHESDISPFIKRLCKGSELGFLKKGEAASDEALDEAEIEKPWVKERPKLTRRDFPEQVEIVKADMCHIPKAGFSQRALDTMKRLAAFKNPQFYKNQAMRMPTYNIPRVICCAENFNDYLGLPRGCEDDLRNLMAEFGVGVRMADKTNPGGPIRVRFTGVLTEEQQQAADELLKHGNGVLSATTAFGKTVLGIYLIGRRQVNTLILVHRRQLLSQWRKRISEFLEIHETLPDSPKKQGRKKEQSLIGQLGAGKNRLSNIVDVGLLQSLNSGGVVKPCIRNYGMVLVDECHHIPAFSFEQTLKSTHARFVYGLTATPARQDGHHPIIFFHCGPVRFQVDAKKQAEQRPFEHYVIPRFTGFKVPFAEDKGPPAIQEIYSELMDDELRNQAIVEDVVDCHDRGRNSLILTNRVAHIQSLVAKLEQRIPDVVALRGGLGTRQTEELMEKISATPGDKPLVIIATGGFIGEGFDEPRLDTLFLVMPVSWRGTLQQYAGRLHRLFENKKDVQVYDYVDVHVSMLEKMYGKRLKGYAAIGYKVKADSVAETPADIIFDKESFFPVYLNDIAKSSHRVLLVSPFVTLKRVDQMVRYFQAPLERGVVITVVTRPAGDFDEKRKVPLERAFDTLKGAGVHLEFRSCIHQKFAVIDHKIVWYGSVNLLSFGASRESIMRLVSGNIACELADHL